MVKCIWLFEAIHYTDIGRYWGEFNNKGEPLNKIKSQNELRNDLAQRIQKNCFLHATICHISKV
jgi:hypothetical protein